VTFTRKGESRGKDKQRTGWNRKRLNHDYRISVPPRSGSYDVRSVLVMSQTDATESSLI